MKVIYRNGYPSRNSVLSILDSYFSNIKGYFPFMTQSINFTGSIHWQKTYINEHIDSLVLFMSENGIEIEDYKLYESPRTGSIKFKKKIK